MNTIYTYFCSLIILTAHNFSQAATTLHRQSLRQVIPTQVTASILINADSGQILSEHKSKQQRPPASLTKLMTLFVAFNQIQAGHLDPKASVHITPRATQADGYKMALKPHTDQPLEVIIGAITTASANDASIALAEHIAGSEDKFVQMMNTTAQEIGMQQTHFRNASGLPEKNHISTAYDLALLARRLIKDHPKQLHRFSNKWFTLGKFKQFNRNRLLWSDPSVFGLKTGHTDEAGYCLAVAARKQEQIILAITLGSPSDKDRTHAATTLLTQADIGFKHLNIHHAENLPLIPVRYGQRTHIQPSFGTELLLSIPKHQHHLVKKRVQHPHEVSAPIKKGDILGYYQLVLDNKLIANHPLVSSVDIPESGLLAQLSEWLYNRIYTIF